MTFNLPTLFKSALQFLRRKGLLPTSLGTAEIRGLAASVRRRSIFAARMTQIRAVQSVKDAVVEMLSGGNLADGKLRLQSTLKDMGYNAEAGGFPQDPAGTVEPALRGSLRDLASQKRMQLILDTQYRMAANEAFITKGLTDEARWQFPCWELVRIGRRNVPRGKVMTKDGLEDDPGQDWPSRWVAAGGELWERETRMIAPKDSAVWQALGDGAGGFEDTLGNPFPPFAFGSGYGLREVGREECLLIGVISETDEIAKPAKRPEPGVKDQRVDDETLDWFKAQLERRNATGKITVAERLKKAGRSASDLVKVQNVRNRLRALVGANIEAHPPEPLARD